MLAAADLTGIGVIVAAILGGGGAAAGINLLKIGSERKREDARTDQISADTLIKVNAELRIELERRGEEIAERDRQLVALRQRYDALRAQFDALEVEFRRVEKRNGTH